MSDMEPAAAQQIFHDNFWEDPEFALELTNSTSLDSCSIMEGEFSTSEVGEIWPTSGVNLPDYRNDEDLDCLRLWESSESGNIMTSVEAIFEDRPWQRATSVRAETCHDNQELETFILEDNSDDCSAKNQKLESIKTYLKLEENSEDCSAKEDSSNLVTASSPPLGGNRNFLFDDLDQFRDFFLPSPFDGSRSCGTNPEIQIFSRSTNESISQAIEEQSGGSLMPAASLDSPQRSDCFFQSHLNPAQSEYESNDIDSMLNNRQGVEGQAIDAQLDYPSHSPLFSSSQIFVDCVPAEPTSPSTTVNIFESSSANVRLGGKESTDSDSLTRVGETVPTNTKETLHFVPVARPEFRPDFTVNFQPLIETPIPENRLQSSVYPIGSWMCSSPSHCPENTEEGPTSETEGSAQSTGRKLRRELLVRDQHCQLSLNSESHTFVPEEHAASTSGPPRADRKSAKRRRKAKETGSPTPTHNYIYRMIVPNGALPKDPPDEFWRKMEQINHEFFETMQKICKTMMGTVPITDFPGLDDDLIRTIYIHQRCQDERRPFHIHPRCASMPDATAAECCWSKQFGRTFTDDDKIMRSIEQMCTKVVNDALYGTPKNIVEYPGWVVEKCEEVFKTLWIEQSGPRKMNYPRKELEKLAESTGLRADQVRRRLESAAKKFRKGAKLDEVHTMTADQPEFTTTTDCVGDQYSSGLPLDLCIPGRGFESGQQFNHLLPMLPLQLTQTQAGSQLVIYPGHWPLGPSIVGPVVGQANMPSLVHIQHQVEQVPQTTSASDLDPCGFDSIV